MTLPAVLPGVPPVVVGDVNSAEIARQRALAESAADRATAAADALDDLTETVSGPNLYNPADADQRRAGKYITSAGAIKTEASWGLVAVPVTAGQTYTLWTNTTRRAGLAFYTADPTDANYLSGSYIGTVTNPQTVTAPAGAAYMIFNLWSNSIAEPSQVMLNTGSNALEYEAYFTPYPVLSEQSVNESASGPKLRLRGAGSTTSYIDTPRGATSLRQEFYLWPTASLTDSGLFDFAAITIGGFVIKTATDDTAPVHAMSATLGAGHGYKMSRLTATAHGKTSADIGQVLSNGGAEWIIVGIVDANSLYVTARTSDAYATTGTFTYVSGGSDTSNVTASAAANEAMFQCYGSRSLSIEVDGIEITDTSGYFPFQDCVVFRETYEIASKTDIAEWFVTNGEGPHEAEGTIAITNTYRYDREGNLTIHSDYLALKAHDLTDIMVLQAQLANTNDGGVDYYIPKAVTATHESTSYDFQLIEDSAPAAVWSTAFDLTPARCEATGILADRMMMLTDNYGFAMGFLPVQDAAVATRRTQVTNKAMEIRNGTRKVYMRLIDKGVTSLVPGDYFSGVAYRTSFVRPSERTAAYTVRKPGADYLFVDWHDVAAIDRVPVPSDFEGRDFTVVESRNCTVVGELTSRLVVDVDCAGDYAYLILKVSA
jgi:hypothetical protein